MLLWVTNTLSNTVTKLRASDGAPQGTFAVDAYPSGVAFDEANIWTANFLSNSVTKLTPASTPPQTVTQNVFGELVALAYTISDKQNRKQLDDAIDRLSKSLEHELWIDPSHPNPKKGEKVFEDQKEAVKKLLDLIKDKKSTVPDAPLQGFVGGGRCRGGWRQTRQGNRRLQESLEGRAKGVGAVVVWCRDWGLPVLASSNRS